ncbi:hypothetical protein HJFPF1_08417 [Paramyrothecium foliicola]|nr:hypothetical protein HJFPF1_08417 [Paramyrothecium foliicola]
MEEHTPKEKTKARKSGSSLLSKVTQLGLGANVFAAAVYWEPTHRCHRVAVYLPLDYKFLDYKFLDINRLERQIRDALPDGPPSPGAWRRHRLPTRYDYDDKEKAKARKSGPSLLNKTIELGESARIFAATIYWEPTHRLYEVAAYLPEGEFTPRVHNLVGYGSFFWTKYPPMATTSPITCKMDPECSTGDGLVLQQGPVDSTVEVNTTTPDMEEEEVEHMGFSEQLNSEPCDLRSPVGLIYPDECEAAQEATMNPSLMDPETAVPTTEMTPPAELLPAETLPAETLLARTPPMETPMVDHAQSQAHPFISINRIDVQVVTRRGSTPYDEEWKKQVLHLLDRTHAILASVLQ